MKKMSFSMFTVLITVLVITGTASALVIHVPGKADLTIQRAINRAIDGDEIVVADGVYTGAENTNIDLQGLQITLRSENGPDGCIIDGGNANRGFDLKTNETNKTEIVGFTITNCNGNQQGGNGGDGGAILCNGSSPTIKRCIIRANRAASGGGVALVNSKAKLINCLIIGNAATVRSGAVDVAENSAAKLINCTISSNSALGGTPGGIFVQASKLDIRNSILWGDMSPEIGKDKASTLTTTYSNIKKKNMVGAGMINANPDFRSSIDFKLKSTSPCIDAGDPVNQVKTKNDCAGDPRIRDGNGDGKAVVDMGAYEF